MLPSGCRVFAAAGNIGAMSGGKDGGRQQVAEMSQAVDIAEVEESEVVHEKMSGATIIEKAIPTELLRFIPPICFWLMQEVSLPTSQHGASRYEAVTLG